MPSSPVPTHAENFFHIAAIAKTTTTTTTTTTAGANKKYWWLSLVVIFGLCGIVTLFYVLHRCWKRRDSQKEDEEAAERARREDISRRLEALERQQALQRLWSESVGSNGQQPTAMFRVVDPTMMQEQSPSSTGVGGHMNRIHDNMTSAGGVNGVRPVMVVTDAEGLPPSSRLVMMALPTNPLVQSASPSSSTRPTISHTGGESHSGIERSLQSGSSLVANPNRTTTSGSPQSPQHVGFQYFVHPSRGLLFATGVELQDETAMGCVLITEESASSFESSLSLRSGEEHGNSYGHSRRYAYHTALQDHPLRDDGHATTLAYHSIEQNTTMTYDENYYLGASRRDQNQPPPLCVCASGGGGGLDYYYHGSTVNANADANTSTNTTGEENAVHRDSSSHYYYAAAAAAVLEHSSPSRAAVDDNRGTTTTTTTAYPPNPFLPPPVLPPPPPPLWSSAALPPITSTAASFNWSFSSPVPNREADATAAHTDAIALHPPSPSPSPPPVSIILPPVSNDEMGGSPVLGIVEPETPVTPTQPGTTITATPPPMLMPLLCHTTPDSAAAPASSFSPRCVLPDEPAGERRQPVQPASSPPPSPTARQLTVSSSFRRPRRDSSSLRPTMSMTAEASAPPSAPRIASNPFSQPPPPPTPPRPSLHHGNHHDHPHLINNDNEEPQDDEQCLHDSSCNGPAAPSRPSSSPSPQSQRIGSEAHSRNPHNVGCNGVPPHRGHAERRPADLSQSQSEPPTARRYSHHGGEGSSYASHTSSGSGDRGSQAYLPPVTSTSGARLGYHHPLQGTIRPSMPMP